MDDKSSVSSSETDRITADFLAVPRLYQTELLEEAKKRNIIIRADTGSGKTLVACELIIWMALQPKSTNHHQIQVFLVPTRPLAHQQAEFIKSRSQLRVQAFAGDIQPEFSKVDKLQALFNEIDVLVSTPKLFYDLISKGYWKFENVSLLVFDEAHHCRKNHLYNQIMRTQYHRLAQDPKQRLPKILGMTASPIWDYKNLQQAEKDVRILQSALAAQLYEIKNQVEDASQYNFKPNQSTVYYEPNDPFVPLTYPPWDQVNQLMCMYGNDRLISNLKSVYSELGLYAYMQSITFWLKSLLTLENPKQWSSDHISDPSRQKAVKEIIQQIDQSLTIEDVSEKLLSSKMITLNKVLVDYLHSDEQREFQCIVFVEKRLHAQLLSTLLQCNARLKDSIRPIALVGHGSNLGDGLGFSMNSKAQNNAVQKLRNGESNLVIATNVAEEGLDFQSCRLVIRFDEITSWKGYIQSRGRARAQNSDYIVMVQTGSGPNFSSFIDKEEELRSLVYDRPENELIGDAALESTPQLICQLPSGHHSILTYNASTCLLNDLCQLVPSDEFLPAPLPDFEFQFSAGKYVCQLTLPPMAALLPSQRTFSGESMPTKKDAKRSAAFAACKVLRELGVLNENFLPHREDRTSSAQDANGRKLEDTAFPDPFEVIVPNVYGDIWNSSEIWIHKLSFPDDSPSGFSTMGLLCGRQLRIPDGLRLFNHFNQSEPMAIKFDEILQIEWDRDDAITNLGKLEKFTRVVLQGAVNRKAYLGKLFFLVAPLLNNTCKIDWGLVENPLFSLSSIDDFSNYPCILAPLHQLHCRIIDKYELCPDLSDSSPPSTVPTCPEMHQFLKKIQKFQTLGHFYKVIYDLSDAQYEGKSLVYLETTFRPTNNLSPAKPLPVTPSKILLPLINCKGTHISRSDWKMYSYLPSLTRILHDACQATALLEKLKVEGTQATLTIMALTPPGVGVPWDYQTLETVGDAFLKLATSIHVYLVHLKKGEGDMSLLRSRSVDNAYLRRKAIQANLPAYILSQRFRVNSFRDAQTENGKALENGTFSRKIPRRVLSDVVEALLGAGYLSGGVELGLKFGTALDLCFGGLTPWYERELNLSFGSIASDSLPSSVIFKYKEIERKINYVFKNKLLLVQALTHRSANSFYTNCYEREEWLGDAVIDMWIVEHAYHRFIDATAEELTLARAKVVSNGSLGFLAIRKLGLHDVIIHNSETFMHHCKEAMQAIDHFETIGNFYSSIDNLFVIFEPPKILNDVFEAIVGAVLIDSRFDIQTTYRALDLIFEDVTPELSQLAAYDPLSRLLQMRDKYQCTQLTRKSQLLQMSNPDGGNQPRTSTRVCWISLHGQEVAVGRHAESAGVAEQRAALEALKVLGEITSMTDNGISNSLWSKCQCKSRSILMNKQGRKITTSTCDFEGAADDLNADEIENPSYLRGDKEIGNNLLDSAKGCSLEGEDHESINHREDVIADCRVDSSRNDSKISREDGSNKRGKDEFIDIAGDDSMIITPDNCIYVVEDHCADIVKDNLIGIIQDDLVETLEDDLVETLEDDFVETLEDDLVETLEDGLVETLEDNFIDIQEDDFTKHTADKLEKNRADESQKIKAAKSKKNRNGASSNKKDDAPKSCRLKKLTARKESPLNKSMEATRDIQQITSQARCAPQGDILIQTKQTDHLGRSKRKSVSKNVQLDDTADMKVTVEIDDDEKIQPRERIARAKIIEISDDSDAAPRVSKRRRNGHKLQRNSSPSFHRTCVVVIPAANDAEIIATRPRNKPSHIVDTNHNHCNQDELSSNNPVCPQETGGLKKPKKSHKIKPSSKV